MTKTSIENDAPGRKTHFTHSSHSLRCRGKCLTGREAPIWCVAAADGLYFCGPGPPGHGCQPPSAWWMKVQHSQLWGGPRRAAEADGGPPSCSGCALGYGGAA